MATAEECVGPEDLEANGGLVAIADPHELAIGSRREDAGVGGHIELAVRWVESDPVEVDHLLSGHSTGPRRRVVVAQPHEDPRRSQGDEADQNEAPEKPASPRPELRRAEGAVSRTATIRSQGLRAPSASHRPLLPAPSPPPLTRNT